MLRVAAVAILAGGLSAAMPAAAQTVECTRFRTAMTSASGDLKADFVRPLVVSRGGQSGLEQYDLVTHARIDGVLRCRGEVFVSFEATIHMPADGALLERFATAQTAALVAALGWAHGRAAAKIHAVAHDADDYLRGSAERGDVVVAGKLEEHLPGGFDIGAIWTRTERTFILLNGN